jgi:hypothetical protein
MQSMNGIEMKKQSDIIATIKDIIIDKITYVDTKITQVAKGMQGISKLIDADKNEYTADLYLDCSGFKSALLEKTLGAEFIEYIQQEQLQSVKHIPQIIISVAKHQSQRVHVIDPVITMLSCIYEIQGIIKSN